MKPLLTTLAFIGLTAAVIIAVVSCSTAPVIPPNQGVELLLGDPNAHPPKYVELKRGTEGRLRAALARIKGHNGICEITFLDQPPGTPNRHYCANIPARLTTDTVIKSATAMNGPDNSAANDPHLMYRVASPISTDISDVAILLK